MSKRHRKPGKPLQTEISIHDSRKRAEQKLSQEIDPVERANLAYERRKAFWASTNVVLFCGVDFLITVGALSGSPPESMYTGIGWLFAVWVFGLCEYGMQVSRDIGYFWGAIPQKGHSFSEHLRQKREYLKRNAGNQNTIGGTYVFIGILHLVFSLLIVIITNSLPRFMILGTAMIMLGMGLHLVSVYIRYGIRKLVHRLMHKPIIDTLEGSYMVGEDGEIESL